LGGLEHIQRGQRAWPVTQVVNAFVALPRLLTQPLGSGGMLIDIGHGPARVELGFDISGVHKTSNRWIQKDRPKRWGWVWLPWGLIFTSDLASSQEAISA
jgi:hypothetical protein